MSSNPPDASSSYPPTIPPTICPPPPPPPSQDWSSNPSLLHTTSFSFKDTSNRRVLLRGVNLSGASKAPVGCLSHLPLVHEGEYGDLSPSLPSSSSSPSSSSTSSPSSSPRVGDPATKNPDRNAEDPSTAPISFKSRPLNLTDGSADIHLARLRGWGFNMLRFPFTWEALEHAGPGIYDYEYMDYIVQCLVKCKEYGFRVFMDPHQDTWSRFSGGSGAPFWTLAACGIDPHNITATQAAILHSEYFPPPTKASPSNENDTPQPEPENLPAMVWSTNYGRLLSQTLFTLFFAGRDFAPNCIIDGQNIQDYLQTHFIEACGQLADRIAAYDASFPLDSQQRLYDNCVIGWDSMNEPFEGLVGWSDLNKNPEKQGSTLKKGTWPTPAQSMRLGMGKKEIVESWYFGKMGPKKEGMVEIDPGGRKVWVDAGVGPSGATKSDKVEKVEEADRHPTTHVIQERPDGYHPHFKWHRDTSRWKLGTCIWAQHGVWDVETGYILQPEYFRYHPVTRVEVEFLTDYWKPHFVGYAKRIKARGTHEGAIMFVQPPVFAVPPKFNGVRDGDDAVDGRTEQDEEDEGQKVLANRAVYSPHYYDGLTLITRHWNWFNADALGLLRGKYRSPLSAVKVGESAIRRSLREQMAYLQADVPGSFGYPDPSAGSGVGGKKVKMLGQYPTLMGEIGTPFDMDSKRSYGWGPDGKKWKGNYENQERALDASLQACDVWLEGWKKGWGDVWESRSSSSEVESYKQEEERDTGRPGESVNWTVWTYVPDDHSHAWGDGWNLEDLSLFSIDDLPCSSSSEDESGSVWSSSEEDEEERYKPNDGSGDDEEAMHSRAVLLRHTAGQDGVIARPPKTRTRTHKNDRYTHNQPGKSLAMEAARSSFSLATLGGAAGASSTSLALARGDAEHQRRRRKHAKGGAVVKDDKLSMRTVVTVRSSSPSSSSSISSSRTHSLASSRRLRKKTKKISQGEAAHPYLDIAGYHPNPYVFLTAGARAPRAFARPWPIKVIGRAVDVRFDIAKGWFRMVVWVEEEDALVDEGMLDAEESRKRTERLATEVYIPLVHYAHPRLVEDVRRGGMGEAWCMNTSNVHKEVVDPAVDGGAEDVTYPPSSPTTTKRTPTPWSDSTAVSRPSSAKAPLLIDPTSPYLYSSSPSSSSSSSVTKPHSCPPTDMDGSPEHEHPPLVDLDVSVSGGTYAVRGQTLLWWYDAPTPGSGYKRKEYVLEVKRKGGVLEFPLRKDKPKSLKSNNGSERTLCDALCPEEGIGSCVIA